MPQSKAELLKAVNEVLDEAIATYEKLEKSFDNTEEVQDPSKPSQDLQKEAAPVMDAAPEEKKEEKEEPEEDEKKEKKDKKEDKEDEKDEDESDEKLMEAYKSLCAKMESKGLIKKSETAVETKTTEVKSDVVQKSENTEVKDNSKGEIETLKKSFADQIGTLHKKMDTLSQAVEKIAKAPAAPRKGLSGATPLRKSGDSEGKEVLTKNQALDKLIELRQKGDQRIDTALINRVETGRLTKTDFERLNSILG